MSEESVDCGVVSAPDPWVEAALAVLDEAGGEFRDHGWCGAQGWIRTTMQEAGGVRLVVRFVYFNPGYYSKLPYVDFILTVMPEATPSAIAYMAAKVTYLKEKAPVWLGPGA